MAAEVLQGGRFLSQREISAFCAQMAMILKSGISVSEGISIMFEDTQDPAGKEILEFIYSHVDKGSTLHRAIEASGRFPDYVVNMVEIGETTGKLENVMDSLCAYYEREEAISKSIRHAVMYPIIMIAMMLTVIVVLVVRIMPIFNEVFQSLGSQLTGFALNVMRFGETLSHYSMFIVGIVALVTIVLLIMSATPGGRQKMDRFRSGFFATRNLYAKIASGRFASAMALTLSSGLDTDQSLEMVHRLLKSSSIREKVEDCQQYLKNGLTFSEAVVKAGIFSGLYARMVTVAFKTGSMDTVMAKIAERYEEETDTQISNVMSILEPSLVAVLSVIVGMILLSVMLPLMSIMTSIG